MNDWKAAILEELGKKFRDAFVDDDEKRMGSNAYLKMGVKLKYVLGFIEQDVSKALDKAYEQGKRDERDNLAVAISRAFGPFKEEGGVGLMVLRHRGKAEPPIFDEETPHE